MLVPKTTDVPKTDRDAQLIYPMLRHRRIHVSTRYRLLLLHFQNTFVFMKENPELKSHHVLVSSQN